MAHYAKIENNIVVRVVPFEDGFDSSTLEGTWIKTSYNTQGGVHLNGEIPLRKNFAGLGYTYDSTRDAFISPQPFPSWLLNEDSCTWECPVEYPTDENTPYMWDEETTTWADAIAAVKEAHPKP